MAHYITLTATSELPGSCVRSVLNVRKIQKVPLSEATWEHTKLKVPLSVNMLNLCIFSMLIYTTKIHENWRAPVFMCKFLQRR